MTKLRSHPEKGDLMHTRKIAPEPAKGKSLVLDDYDHFVALDWAERTMAVGHLGRRVQAPVVFERAANVRELKAYLATLRGRIVMVIEETTASHWLYLELRGSVERLVICNPYHNRLLTHGPKTDRIDAGKLCLLLKGGLLQEVYHSTDRLFELRTLVSAYQDVVKAGVRAKCQRSALTRARAEGGAYGAFITARLDQVITDYEVTKAEYEKQFHRASRRYPQLKLLTPITGIGVIGAAKILATVVDARRFKRRGQYWAYCGLAYNEKFSGGRFYGRRKPKYSHVLKSVYKSAALAALRGQGPVREYYERLLADGVPEHNARHAVARYIAGASLGVLKTGTPYDPYRWRKSSSSSSTAKKEDKVA
jgi:transposase